MADTPALSYEYHIILGRPERGQILLLPGEDGWRLLSFAAAERRSWQYVDHVGRALAERYGLEADVLRCAAIGYERDSDLVSKIYVAVARDAAWSPPAGAVWVTRAELADIALARPGQRPAIVEWFHWYAGSEPAPGSRVPWYRPGWHATAASLIADQLERLGIAQSGAPAQLRSSQRSAILCVPTGRGDIYFKAVPPVFAHEPALTAALAAIDPQRVGAPLALDADQGWMLTPALAGASLDRQPDIELWAAALRSFAALQISCAAHLGSLRSTGLPERPLDQLAAQIDSLLTDTSLSRTGRPAGLSADQRASLADQAPRLRQMCAELAGYGLPMTIEHGDLWAGQIIAGPAGFHFLDWSDSALAHPFFSLLLFLLEVEDHFPKEPGVRERLRDAYLEPWAALMPPGRLIRAFELAQPLAALHHALTYQQMVLPNMEVGWEMEIMLPFYLKMLLRLVQAKGLGQARPL